MSPRGECKPTRVFLSAAPLHSATVIIVGAMAGPSSAGKPSFGSLEDAFAGPRARYFGVNGDGSPKDAHTHYKSHTPNLIFEVSNGMILAAVDRNGLVVNAVVMQAKDNWPGSSSLPFRIRVGAEEARLDETANIGVELLGGIFPVHTFDQGSLRLQQLVFAPDLPGVDSAGPRAIIVVFRAENRGHEPVGATLRVKKDLADVSRVKDGSPRAELEADCYPRYPERKKQFKAGYQAVACLGDTDWKPAHPDVGFAVPAGGTAIITLALMVGDTPEDVSAAARLVRRHTVLEWLNGTWAIHAGRVGRLSVPDDPYYSELYTRLVEETCNSTLISRDGKATNTDAGDPLLSIVDPVLAARVLRVPGHSRLDDFDSLYACMWAVWQRAIYYQVTGDALFFRENPGEMERAHDAFNDALAHKSWDSPFLFPCRYIWDGLARGDWHTGSNIILWHCWKQWSRIARYVYRD